MSVFIIFHEYRKDNKFSPNLWLVVLVMSFSFHILSILSF